MLVAFSNNRFLFLVMHQYWTTSNVWSKFFYFLPMLRNATERRIITFNNYKQYNLLQQYSYRLTYPYPKLKRFTVFFHITRSRISCDMVFKLCCVSNGEIHINSYFLILPKLALVGGHMSDHTNYRHRYKGDYIN